MSAPSYGTYLEYNLVLGTYAVQLRGRDDNCRFVVD